MRNRPFAVFAACTALALGVAACGGDDEEEPAASSAPTTEQGAPAEPAESTGGQDIVALAQGNAELSTLVEAVTAADLAPTLQGDGPFTVFAPTNDAFAAVPKDDLDALLQPENKQQLADLLSYHVVEGELKAADLQDGQKLKTVQGEELTVSVEGSDVKVGDATVAMPDVDASNGVVHVIDTVLMP